MKDSLFSHENRESNYLLLFSSRRLSGERHQHTAFTLANGTRQCSICFLPPAEHSPQYNSQHQ